MKRERSGINCFMPRRDSKAGAMFLFEPVNSFKKRKAKTARAVPDEIFVRKFT
jgi:hypothetical protein